MIIKNQHKFYFKIIQLIGQTLILYGSHKLKTDDEFKISKMTTLIIFGTGGW